MSTMRFPLIRTRPNAPSDYYNETADHMAQIHNMFLRGLNAIHAQAKEPQTTMQARRYLSYVSQWHENLHHHHQNEEVALFPVIDRLAGKPVMQVNVDQHHTFLDGAQKMRDYADDEENWEHYSSTKMLELVEAFGDAFTTHMHDEIDTLRGLKDHITEDQLRDAWMSLVRYMHGY